MSVVLILILASLGVAVAFLGGFVWAVRSGQYEDTLTPAMRMPTDDATTKNHLQKIGGPAAPFPVSDKKTGAAKKIKHTQ